MNIKTRISLIIIFTLVTGIIIGAMLNRALLQRRIAQAFSWRDPATIVTNLERTLNPDTGQAQQIRKILEAHAETFDRIREDSRQELMAAQKALIDDLVPVLTPEQKVRWQRGPMGPQRFLRRGRGYRREGRPESDWGAQLSPLQRQLDLSREQVFRIQEILREQTPQNPPGLRDFQAIEQIILRWKSQQRMLDQALGAVLTEEQQQKYAGLKEERLSRIQELLLR